ncbi:MAG: squalene--hopene cyclase [Verrucomicrobiales bacterium]|nr:squalene--hopene cyclase [Verrucomicrobiales bacterium]
MDRAEIATALENARAALLAERTPDGHWEGELSTSALSTATAVVALGSVDSGKHAEFVEGGVSWLAENQNFDGGWGDTVKSDSNISTSLLAWSALSKFGPEKRDAIHRAENWIRSYVGSLDPQKIAETVKARYGKDRTFSVPILMLCAICGRLGKNGWRLVPQFPFELSLFPREWFAILRLPVVSYALPALIAIGYGKLQNSRGISPIRLFRNWAWKWRASSLLREIQPASGGFLEAAPLTSFVTMALANAGQKHHPVAEKGVQFLTENVRPDGSWPIDTNLATWVTTLAVKALATNQQGLFAKPTLLDRKSELLDWLVNQQYRDFHPFTNSPPGGWAWTDLSGGVPDADDTPGTLLALKILDPTRKSEAEMAIRWLFHLQNRDGGMPTFCRGWGALPFDRSSADLTAHAIRAWLAWRSDIPDSMQAEIDSGIEKGLRFLARTQNRDGSWTPLWFGNQHLKRDEENPTYGTSMVLRALHEVGTETAQMLAADAIDWLYRSQNLDGGWGGGSGTPSSIEETALAISALCHAGEFGESIDAGVRWLIDSTNNGSDFPATPIGFYFAKLWYFERLYPLVWAVEALGKALQSSAESSRPLS